MQISREVDISSRLPTPLTKLHLAFESQLLTSTFKYVFSPMLLSNYFNRNITDVLTPLFETIFCIEVTSVVFYYVILAIQLLFIVSTVLLGALIIFVMLKTTIFHRTVNWHFEFAKKNEYMSKIRLRVIFGILNAIVYELSRIAVLYHQYYGPRIHGCEELIQL